MLIDHLIYRASDLGRAVADVEERFGVRGQAGGKHIGLGTHNALLALGPRTYLEIIAPDPSQPQPSMPDPSGADRAGRGGLVGWAITCPDIDAAVAGARSRGYDPGEVADMQRASPTGAESDQEAAADPVVSAGAGARHDRGDPSDADEVGAGIRVDGLVPGRRDECFDEGGDAEPERPVGQP